MTTSAPASPRVVVTIGLMLVASALVAGTSLLAKALGTGFGGAALSPFQVTAGRYFFALLILVAYIALVRPAMTRPDFRLHGVRVLCGWAGVTAMFAAAALIPLADAMAISFLNPIFALLFAMPILSERVGWRRWSAAFVCFAGALFLIRPGLDSFQPLALIALFAAVVLGIEGVLVKRLSQAEGTLQILLMSNLLGSVLSAVAVAFVWVTPSGVQWLAMAGIGVLMIATQVIFLMALRRGDVSFVQPLFYATLIFSALYDAVFYAVTPTALSALGIATILGGAVLLGLSEHRRARAARAPL